MEQDQVIARIRKVRHHVSQECDHNPQKIVDYYKKLQIRHEQLLLPPEKEPEESSGDFHKA